MTTTNVFTMGVDKVVDDQYAKDFGYTTPGWYFTDESQAFMHGPYTTREEAELKSCEYFEWLSPGSTAKQSAVARA